MTHRDKSDHEMRRRFAELRNMDEADAPSFATVIRASHNSRTKQDVRVWRGSAVLLGACAAGVLVTAIWMKVHGRDEFTPQEIAEWRPRSDALLVAARQSLLTDIPPLRASALDPILR